MLGTTGSVGRPELGTDQPGSHPVEVSVGPLGGGPGGGELDVGAEVHLVQLVVDELSDVPGEVVVSRNLIIGSLSQLNTTDFCTESNFLQLCLGLHNKDTSQVSILFLIDIYIYPSISGTSVRI